MTSNRWRQFSIGDTQCNKKTLSINKYLEEEKQKHRATLLLVSPLKNSHDPAYQLFTQLKCPTLSKIDRVELSCSIYTILFFELCKILEEYPKCLNLQVKKYLIELNTKLKNNLVKSITVFHLMGKLWESVKHIISIKDTDIKHQKLIEAWNVMVSNKIENDVYVPCTKTIVYCSQFSTFQSYRKIPALEELQHKLGDALNKGFIRVVPLPNTLSNTNQQLSNERIKISSVLTRMLSHVYVVLTFVINLPKNEDLKIENGLLQNIQKLCQRFIIARGRGCDKKQACCIVINDPSCGEDGSENAIQYGNSLVAKLKNIDHHFYCFTVNSTSHDSVKLLFYNINTVVLEQSNTITAAPNYNDDGTPNDPTTRKNMYLNGIVVMIIGIFVAFFYGVALSTAQK